MKSFMLFLFIIAFQIPNQQKAQLVVSRYLKDNIEFPNGYQAIQFGNVTKFMSSYGLTAFAQDELLLLKQRLHTAEEYKKNGNEYQSNKILVEVNDKIEELKQAAIAFKKKQIGWQLYHKYRQKINNDNWEIKADTFYMDMTYRIISLDTFTLKISQF